MPAGQLWPTGSCATAQGANCASWPSGAHWLLCHPLGLVCGPLHSIAPTGHPGPRATVPPQRPSGPPGNCAICTIGAADGLVGKNCRRLLLRMPLRACVPVRACRARAQRSASARDAVERRDGRPLLRYVDAWRLSCASSLKRRHQRRRGAPTRPHSRPTCSRSSTKQRCVGDHAPPRQRGFRARWQRRSGRRKHLPLSLSRSWPPARVRVSATR